MHTLLSTFDRAKVEPPDVYFSNEEGFYDAYRNHLEIAKAIAELDRREFYIVAYIELVISIECFLKDIFCIIRHDVLDRNGGKDKVLSTNFDQLFSATVSNEILKDITCKNRFGHNITRLADFISTTFSILNSDSSYKEFASYLPTDDWINDRYKNPTRVFRRDYKSKYLELVTSFEVVLSGTLARFR